MYIKLEEKERFNYIMRSIFTSLILFAFMVMLILVGDTRFHASFTTNAIITVGAFAVVFYFKEDPLGTRYFLLSFEIKDDNVNIRYKDKMIFKEINGKRNEFKAIKNKGRTGRYGSPPYLQINYNGEKLLRQYFYRGWSEKKIDEIVSCL